MTTRDARDLPWALLAACVCTLGAGRPEWGRAMLAELASLEGGRERLTFALGCVHAIAFTVPAGGPQRAIAGGALVGAVGSAGVTAVALLRYPGLVSGARTWVAVGAFAALLLLYVCAAVAFGARLGDGHLLTTAAVAGSAIAASWLAVGLDASLEGPAGLGLALLGIGLLVAVGVGWSATTRSGSSRAGVGAVGVTALVAGFALFLAWAGEAVATAGRPYDVGLLHDFRASGAPSLSTYAVNDSLGTGMMLLLLVPLVSLACGLLGAAAGLTRTRPQV